MTWKARGEEDMLGELTCLDTCLDTMTLIDMILCSGTHVQNILRSWCTRPVGSFLPIPLTERWCSMEMDCALQMVQRNDPHMILGWSWLWDLLTVWNQPQGAPHGRLPGCSGPYEGGISLWYPASLAKLIPEATAVSAIGFGWQRFSRGQAPTKYFRQGFPERQRKEPKYFRTT